MEYVIELERAADQLRVLVPFHWDEKWDATDSGFDTVAGNCDYRTQWFWTSGNFGCDCNRAIQFHNQLPETVAGEYDESCGDSRYHLLSIFNLDMRRFVDFDEEDR